MLGKEMCLHQDSSLICSELYVSLKLINESLDAIKWKKKPPHSQESSYFQPETRRTVGKIDTLDTHMYDHSLSWLVMLCTLVKSGDAILILDRFE